MDNQAFRKRVGILIKQYVCNKYNLFFNKQQIKKGYYDAYDKNFIYEIKAAYINSNRFIINKNNHIRLNDINGKYIFVIYDLLNKDKKLQIMTDINIKNILILNFNIIHKLVLNKKCEIFNKKNNREYVRININTIFKLGV
jgi:hypothetical protein